MKRTDRVTDATFEVISPGSGRPANWYPGRKELPGWFKKTMLVLATLFWFVGMAFANWGAPTGHQAAPAAGPAQTGSP